MAMLSSWWTRLAAARWHALALATPLVLSLGCDGISMPTGRPCAGRECASSGGSNGAGSSGGFTGSSSSGSSGGSSGSGSSSSSSGGSSSSSGSDGSPAFRSPYAVAYSGDGALLAATDATAGELVILDPAAMAPVRAAVKLAGRPKGLAWSGPGRVLVAEYGAGTVAEVDTTAGSVVRRLQVGSKATDVAVTADGARVVVPDLGLGQVLILDRATGQAQPPVPVAPYPFAVALAPGGNTAVVTHLVASGDATRPDTAASITLLDVASGKVSASLRLPFGSSAVRGVRCSPDGKWAYAVHTVGRTTLPTTQLSRGWISTNALSIIDLAGQRLYATVLLDRLNEGAADLWGVDVSRDGSSLWVSASGVHQVLRVDLALLHKLLAGQIPSELVRTPGRTPTLQDRSKAAYNRPLSDVWFEVAADPSKRSLLVDDLGALYGAGALQIFQLAPAQGPRGIALSPDGKQLAVALYFAGQVGLVKTATGSVDRFVDVGTQPPETWVRQGERVFHDASSTLQGWVSCATCHVDGRADGLNWDLVNDGLGNPKNTKSVVYMPNTPPAMAHGIFATPAEAITGEFQYVKAFVPEPAQLAALGAYFNALAAEPDPFRQGGSLSAAAQRGQAVFERVGCGQCHAGKYRTDMKTHDVGTRNGRDSRADFDTPSLTELWRTAPYLHDGSAATLKDVLTTRNAGDKHSKTSGLSAQDLGDLVQYLLELDAPAPDRVEVFPPRGETPPAEAFQGRTPTASAAGGLDLTDPRLATLDRILFIKRDFLPTGDHSHGGHMCDQYHGFNATPGGLFVIEGVLSGNPRERNVLASSTCANGPHQGRKLEGGGFLSPELHPDGNQILFAYSDIGRFQTWEEGSTFHIFKVNADGSGLTQLTQGPHNDFDPTWLPDGRIAFISDRRGGFGRCHPRPVPVYTLYVMNADGSNVEPLSYHETNEWQPSLDRNGLLLYTRWDYVDRGANHAHNAWITNPDGLDARAVVGNYPNRVNVTPRMLMNLRAIPGTNKFVGTASAHHQQAYGSLVIVDPDIEDDDGMGAYTVLTRDAGFPEATVGQDQDLKYATAWPLDENRFLVVHDPSSNEAGLNNKRFAIYLIDRQGNKKLLYRDPNHSCLDPIPLAPRRLPPPLVSSRTAKKTDPTEVVVLNVYDSLLPYPSGVEVKALRVVQVFPKSTPNTISPRKGHGAMLYNDQNGRGSLGTVPVEKDGSARFLLPPGKTVFFQALDADGLAVQSMRSATYAVPGTSRVVCQGCHERRYRAPHAPAEMALALKRPPSTLQPEAEGSWPLSFPRLIQPILDSRCKTCHEGNGQTFSLSQGNYEWNGDRFYDSYSNLKPFAYFYNFNDAVGPIRTTPGDFGARKSRLYPLLKGGHHGVTLSEAERRAFALWLDLNSDMFSDDVKRDAQGRGEAVTPSVE
jgi:mono/diheme cytochrome c family protein